MASNKIKKSLAKRLAPIILKVNKFLENNTTIINYLIEKRHQANDSYNFESELKKLLKDKKLIALDAGSQGGFNSDIFFPKLYEKYFNPILVDPIKDQTNLEGNKYINKGLWSSKENKKLFVLGKRLGSSSMYEPDKNSIRISGFKEKDFHLFDVTETKNIECDTINNCLRNLKINSLDFLKIDTQGAELEILKGLGFYKPLLIKCEVQIHSIYKNTPPWTELLNFLNKLNYIVCDWRTIGPHVTRAPVEMDMVFVPNFLKDEGKRIILDREEEFISLMLICGQIKLLKKISEIIGFKNNESYIKLKDKYFS